VLVELYLLVKINDILDMLYLVQANFEDNFDEINDHLKRKCIYVCLPNARVRVSQSYVDKSESSTNDEHSHV
jgi:hypothetical protein